MLVKTTIWGWFCHAPSTIVHMVVSMVVMCCVVNCRLKMSSSLNYRECKDDIPAEGDPKYWYVNGYAEEPFNLNVAPGAISFGLPPFNTFVVGAGYLSKLRRYSVLVCRVYWKQLAFDGFQEPYHRNLSFPLRVTMALSLILGCDVTHCSVVDIFHYFVDVFGWTNKKYLPEKRPRLDDDLTSVMNPVNYALGIRDEVLCAESEPRLVRLEYEN